MTNPCKACLNDVSTVCCNCVWYLFHTAYITNIKMKSIISCLLFLCLFLVMRKYGSYPTRVYTSYASRPYYAPSKKWHWSPLVQQKDTNPHITRSHSIRNRRRKDTLGTEWRAIWWICLDSYFVSTFESEVVETFLFDIWDSGICA